MPKGWVFGLVVSGAASGAFGWADGSEFQIVGARMPPIEMVGGNVVTGKNYPIVISYTAKCGDDIEDSSCGEQKIRFSVSQTKTFSGCFPTSPTWLKTRNLRDWFLGSPPNKHRVDYHNGGEEFTMGKWGSFFALPDVSSHAQVATLTLKNIRNPVVPVPLEKVLGVVGEYQPNKWTSCVHYMPVKPGINERDKVSISGLENAPLNPSGTFTLENVCVYSSTGRAALRFDSTNSIGSEEFQLKQSDSNANTIPYEITVKSKTHGQEETINADGYAGGFWQITGTNIDASDNCIGNPNMRFTVKASPTGNKASGTYQDTITVTVEPR